MSDLGSQTFATAIQSMADLQYLPGYRFDVDPEKVLPVEIVDPYSTKENMVCGISSCHHPHLNGLIVRMADDSLTNFGRDCGKRHFPEVFAGLTRAFAKKRRLANERLILDAFEHRVPTLLRAVEELIEREKGVRWLQFQLERLHVVVPPKTYSHILSMARKGEDVVWTETRRSEVEMEYIRATAGANEAKRQQFVRVELGRLAGVNVVLAQPRRVAVDELRTPLQGLYKHFPLRELQGSDRRCALSLARNYERMFDSCQEILEWGRKFFVSDQILLLQKLAAINGEEKEAKRISFG
jgi:hypothetical protein